jgi:hypothetical protein
MVKPIIDLMLLSSMFGFVSGIMVAGSLANFGALHSSDPFPNTASDVLFSDDGWGLNQEMFE